MIGIEKQIDSETIYNGRIIRLRRDKVELEDGKTTTREVVEASGGACVLAVDENDCIYLVKQYRYPFKKTLLELPAGKLEKGELPEVTALRELEEECGLRAKSVKPLGVLYPTVAFCDEIIYIYFADKFTKTAQALDDGEFIDIIKIPFEEAYKKVMAGEIYDAKTQIAILKYAQLRKL